MGFLVVVGLLVLCGGVFSYVSIRSDTIPTRAWFRYGGLLVWLLLLGLLAGVCGRPAFENILAALVSAAAWFIFLANFFGNTIARWARAALSLDDMTVKPGYSRIEADIRRGAFDDALHRLRELADAHPRDPEPCRRRAELLLKLDRVDDAVRAFREAAGRTEHPDDRAMALFAMTEVMVERRNDLAGAVAALEGFLLEHPESRSRPYVEKRLAALRARRGG